MHAHAIYGDARPSSFVGYLMHSHDQGSGSHSHREAIGWPTWTMGVSVEQAVERQRKREQAKAGVG